MAEPTIAVIIPSYKVRAHVLNVLAAIGPEVARIYVVDDACPEHCGALVAEQCKDARVKVITHAQNKGVGGAVMSGYEAALEDGMEIFVKIDGDGQMDPALLGEFVAPIIAGEADYTKGNRFFDPEQLWEMPRARLIGNAGLSLMAKVSTGYWNSFDPTNGYTAIHAEVARHLPFHKISERYFFETDMLFRLNIQRAVVVDVPMAAKYGDEISNLNVARSIGEFSVKHLKNFIKRVVYNYYLRDASLASIELPVGVLMLAFGLIYGLVKWAQYGSQHITTPAGTVILATLPVLLGIQFILAFFSQDIANTPTRSLRSMRRARVAS